MLPIDLITFGYVIALSIIANRLVEGLVVPVFDKFEWDKFWLLYVAWVVAGGIVWLAQINLFVEIFPSPLVGLILTAICAGGGANLLHDLVSK
jgi:hypothetical protein